MKRGLLEGLGSGIVVYFAVVGAAAALDAAPESAVWPAALAGGGVALGVLWRRVQVKVTERLEPEEFRLLTDLTRDLPVMLYQFRTWPTGAGSVTFTTPAIRAIYEIEPEEARRDGNQILSLVHPEDHERILQSLVDSHRDLTPWQEDFRVVLPKAGICWRTGHAVVERLADGGSLWHGFVIDITARKEAEAGMVVATAQAEAANQAKSRFLAMMSHDIRAPIAGITGFASLLRDSPMGGTQAGYLDSIERCGKNLLSLVSELLEISRIEAGELDLVKAPFDLPTLLDEIIEMFSLVARNKGIALRTHCVPGTPSTIITDRRRLFQLLTNIVGNAIKFTPSGEVTIKVECDPAGSADRLWRFAVTDTGPGIPAEMCDAVFDPYHRLENVRTSEGSGLGLSITRQICRALGGDALIESPAQGGTTVVATILAAVGPDLNIEASGVLNRPSGAGRTLNVLVVDDSAANARLAALVLRRFGCEPAVAADGREALELCAAKAFDLVLMDLSLPGMSGMETVRVLRERDRGHPAPRRLLIYALSASVLTEDRAACLAAGMDGFVPKPFRDEEILDAVNAARRASRISLTPSND